MRFQIYFNNDSEIIGADITCKLFDITKVYEQGSRETNFHIFYRLRTEAMKRGKWNHLHLGGDDHKVFYL